MKNSESVSYEQKLKQKDLKAVRECLLMAQNGEDPITGLKIRADQAVLDHDHVTGRIRCVLQREVNSFEGKLVNSYNRYIRHLGISLEDILANLVGYWQKDFSENPLHPKHFTPEEKAKKRLLKKYNRLLKASKMEKTKQKYRDLIQKLKDQ